ncbi:hypothetical protein [Sphingomonas sp.]|uniref:hypothetical protein n=1 Tax=Sphingomonas sp. TaxID=28214 RepID=UPI0025EC0FB0|nr:hypothetical protein [Sphingomonas sp.]
MFFDANDGTMEHGYWLIFEQSKADLAALGGALRDGLLVQLYSPNEIEVQAILRFEWDSHRGGMWIGQPIEETLVLLDGSRT